MLEENNQHIKKKNWSLEIKSNLSLGSKILTAIWIIHRNRGIHNREVRKVMSRLNLGGHCTEYISKKRTFMLFHGQQ
jgi:hypothetical protein